MEARLAAALRANLRRRKAQSRARDDLSGRDPNRLDTPLKQGVGETCASSPQDRRNDGAKDPGET